MLGIRFWTILRYQSDGYIWSLFDKAVLTNGISSYQDRVTAAGYVARASHPIRVKASSPARRPATNWYCRGEAKWCNLLLYLTNAYVFKNFGRGQLPDCPSLVAGLPAHIRHFKATRSLVFFFRSNIPTSRPSYKEAIQPSSGQNMNVSASLLCFTLRRVTIMQGEVPRYFERLQE